MIGWQWIINWRSCRRKRSWYNSRYCSDIFLKKMTRNFGRVSRQGFELGTLRIRARVVATCSFLTVRWQLVAEVDIQVWKTAVTIPNQCIPRNCAWDVKKWLILYQRTGLWESNEGCNVHSSLLRLITGMKHQIFRDLSLPSSPGIIC
jgi:hypothetical protein